MSKYFGVIPNRAFVDDRLACLHFRVMGFIAAFERMGGKGCWKGRDQIAPALGCNPRSVSNHIGDLIKWGYIEAERKPRDRRLFVYRVLYTHADRAALTPLARLQGQDTPPGRPNLGKIGHLKLKVGHLRRQSRASGNMLNPLKILRTRRLI